MQARPGQLLQQYARHLRRRRLVDVLRLARIQLHPGDQFAQIVRRQVFARDHELRIDRHQPDRLEILLQIVGQRIDDVADVGVPLAEVDGVAVRRRAREPADPDRAAGAADVLDDHRLAQQRPHALGQNARRHIGRAARRERHDHGDLARRVGLRQRVRSAGQGRDQRDGNHQLFHRAFSDLGLVQGGEVLGRLLLARRHLLAQIMEARTRGRIGQRIDDGGIELADDILWRALGCPQRKPDRAVDSVHPRLVYGRDLGRRGQPAFAHDGVGLDQARPHLRQAVGCNRHREVDLAGNDVLHRRSPAAIGHELEARAGFLLHEGAADVRRAAGARMPHRGLVRVRVQPGDEFLQIVRREIFSRDQDLRTIDHHRDRLEIVHHIKRQIEERAVEHMRAQAAEAQRVTVCGRARDPADADIAAPAPDVFDDHRLAERGAHALGNDARKSVVRSAGGERHHDRNRTRGIDLRRRG